jgi:hypothetical protein
MAIPVVSIAEMREWEQATWAAGQTEAEVIRLVGACVARRALQLTRTGDLILILAGEGNSRDVPLSQSLLFSFYLAGPRRGSGRCDRS